MRTPTAGRALLVSACLVCAMAAFGLALWTYTDVSMFGFPDGYLTDYQRAARTPVAFVVLLLVAAAALVGVPWYFGPHLGLDNGIGG